MAAGDLTDLGAVKAWLGIANTTASDDLLGALITSASAFIVNYLSRSILTASYVETVRGNGGARMLLRNWPITAVASIAWSGQPAIAAGNPAALTPGYWFDGRELNLIGYCFPRGLPVVVSYTAGYATAPPDIAQVANELVGEAFKRKERIGEASKSLGGQETISYSQADISANAKTLLMQYRDVVPI